ncbi:hypothetical protein B0H11DRAFT_2331732 [Mycena galericulata]|nr:hypothetical protein B0H11DRAFT_2331732 [Mycena galericulata]
MPKTFSKTSVKPRRAYLACLICRKQKRKCVSLSASYDRPCTRCAQRGLTCEFLTVWSQTSDSSRQSTPAPESPPPPARAQSGPEIAPPSAGISQFLPTDMKAPMASEGQYQPYPSPRATEHELLLHRIGSQPPTAYAMQVPPMNMDYFPPDRRATWPSDHSTTIHDESDFFERPYSQVQLGTDPWPPFADRARCIYSPGTCFRGVKCGR